MRVLDQSGPAESLAISHGMLPLDKMRIVVVGGGPGGLALAAAATYEGATVSVFERADDPLSGDPRYTRKSFNLTLNEVGRRIIDDARLCDGSIDIEGRAAHDSRSGVTYAPYVGGSAAHQTSIPRPLLQRNLAHIAGEAGSSTHYNSQVLDVNPDDASVEITQNGSRDRVSGDLIVVADGLHSIGNKIVEAIPRGSINLRADKLGYVPSIIPSGVRHNLSLHHLHFWHEPDRSAYTIGVPNYDGSMSLLFVSDFADIAEGAHPFLNHSATRERLAEDYPQLLELDPELVDRLPLAERGRFYYKSSNHFVLGAAGVLVGEAGQGGPPWAGFGANTAMYSAKVLVDLIVANEGDVSAALATYETHLRALSAGMSEFTIEHGDFLSKRVHEHPGERAESSFALIGIIQAACRNSVDVPTVHIFDGMANNNH